MGSRGAQFLINHAIIEDLQAMRTITNILSTELSTGSVYKLKILHKNPNLNQKNLKT